MSKFYTPIDLTGNELRNARAQNLGSSPSNPTAGMFYFDSTSGRFRYYDGSGWVDTNLTKSDIDAMGVDAGSVGGASRTDLETHADDAADDAASNAYDAAIQRANHTGTQDISTVSGLQTALDDKLEGVGVDGPITVDDTDALNPVIGITAATTLESGAMSAADKAKLDDIDSGATANESDSYLLDRSNHTGTQGMATISGLQTALDDKSDTGHGHAISDVSGLQTELDGKSDTGHGHDISDTTGLQGALDDKQDTSEKGQANGYASLDGSSKIPANQIPSLAITETFVVESETEMLGLSAQMGDVAIRTDESKTYILEGSDPSVLGNWREILTPFTGVESVSGSAPITSSGGSNPTIGLEDEGVDTQHLADDAVEEDKLSSDVRSKLNAPQGALKASFDIGDGTETEFTLTHNLGTRDLAASLREAASPYAVVFADIEFPTTDTVLVRFASAPGTDEFRLTVVG